MLKDGFFVLFQKMLFLHLGEKIRFLDLLGEDGDEEVFRGFPDKSITLVDDGLGCGGAHEKTFPGLGFLEVNQSRVVFVHLCEKGQIGLDIGLVSESVLREKHRKLSLSTDGGAKGFGVEGKFLTGELILKIKLQDIVGQPVGFGECLVGKTAQHLLVIFQNQAGSLQDFGLRASESDGSLGNPVVFRMFQGIVKVQGISGQFTAEDLTGKLPERPVVEKDAGGKDQKKERGEKQKGKK